MLVRSQVILLLFLSTALLCHSFTFTVYTAGNPTLFVDWFTCAINSNDSGYSNATCYTYSGDNNMSYGSYISTQNGGLCAGEFDYSGVLSILYVANQGAPRLTDLIQVDVTYNGIYVWSQSPYGGQSADCNYITYSNSVYTFKCPSFNVYVESDCN